MAFEITIPRLGWSMEEGTFSGWLKQDGDTIQCGDPLFELEGEKAIQEIEAVDAGILRIPANGPQPGSMVKVGAVVGYLVAEGESLPVGQTPDASAIVSGNQELSEGTPSLPTETVAVDAALPPAAGPSVRRLARESGVALDQVEGTGRGGRILAEDIERVSSQPLPSPLPPVASPRARRVAAELEIDWTQLTGTGAGGRIREQDVLAARRAPAAGRRIPLTSRRKVIAQRMVASRQQTVPVTLTTKADATNLVNLREQFKTTKGESPIPGYQDIITKLVARVLGRHPLLAGRWEEDAIVLPAENELHLGMAVDTDDGLLVPVLRNVGQSSLIEVAAKSRQLVGQARAGKLTAADMQGSVFTITNLGAFGIDSFTPIINVPETAILGLGAIRREPVALDDGGIVSRHQLTLSLTFDHRILDGAPAARFLQDIATAIANPSAALLS
ncbi:MAG: 2-oxo acid dehydrogenase subunit E2 [Planctomycetaceae bacterium]|jgi:pyruvate dehydrogenase E2 component (dihydrolipoamide acetyltransferase)|nr:2-oxo acid dehydrogenase subunit E2 [Planctomycetaceae bacterium]